MLTRASSVIALTALATAATGCMPFAVPPSRTDLATTFVAGSGKVESGLRVASGVHYASATVARHVPFDVGAGYVFEQFEPQRDDTALVAPRDARAGAPLQVTAAAPRRAQGFYLGAAAAIGGDRHQRGWAGGRAQLVFGPGGPRATIAARLSWELFTTGQASGSESTPCGFTAGGASGTSALGLFVESGAQLSGGDAPVAFVTTVGMSIRLPFVAGVAVDFCHW